MQRKYKRNFTCRLTIIFCTLFLCSLGSDPKNPPLHTPLAHWRITVGPIYTVSQKKPDPCYIFK